MKQKLLMIGLLMTGAFSNAQVGIGTNTPDASAMLDVTSTTKGFLMPRMTTANRTSITSPASGLTIYNTDNQRIEVNIGTPGTPNWQTPTSGTANIYLNDGTLTNNRTVTMAGNTLNFNGANVGIGAASPGSTLQLAGSFAPNYNTVATTPYTIAATDYYVVYNGASAGVFNLPASTAAMKGRLYTIKNTTATQTLTLTPNGAQTINGSATLSVTPGYGVQLVSTGTTTGATWEIVSFGAAAPAAPGTIYTVNGTLNGARNIANAGNSLTISGTAAEGLILNNTASTATDLRVQNTAGQGRIGIAATAGDFGALQAGDVMINGNTAGKGVGISVAGVSAPAVYVETSGNVGMGMTNPQSTLDLGGSFGANYTVVTGNYAVSATDYVVLVNNGSTNVTITLPALAGIDRRMIKIARHKNSTGTVTIQAASGELIEAQNGTTANTTTLVAQGTLGCKVTLQATSAGWARTGNG